MNEFDFDNRRPIAKSFAEEQLEELRLWKPRKINPGIEYKHFPLPDHDVRQCAECHKAKIKAVDDFNATLGYEGAPRAHECGPFADPASKRVKESWRIEAQRFGVLINARCQGWKDQLKAHNALQKAEFDRAMKAHHEKSRK